MGQQKTEKINRPEHTASRSQNKGSEQVQRRARRVWTRPAPPEAGGRGEGNGAGSGPKDRIPYRTANRPPVSNQRPPEILDGRHPPGGSQRDTGRTHQTGGDWGWGCGGEKVHARDWRGWKLRLGPRRGEGARQAPGCLSRSDGEGTKRRCRRVRAFVEHPRARTAQRRARAIESSREPEQRRWESSARPSPQREGTRNPNKRPPPPACVRAEIRHRRDRQTEAKQTKGTASEGTVQQIKTPVGDTDYTGRGL